MVIVWIFKSLKNFRPVNSTAKQISIWITLAKKKKDYANYPIPKFYHFESPEARERILYGNFLKINKEVKDMIAEIQEFNKKIKGNKIASGDSQDSDNGFPLKYST